MRGRSLGTGNEAFSWFVEKQVNQLLSRYSDDIAALRRGSIEYKVMAREVTQGSSTYWRIDQ